MKITVYGKPNCQWCEAAKNLLERKGWAYTYHNLFELPHNEAQNVIGFSGMKTIPIVKVDEIYIGGYDALEGYIRGVEERKI